MRRVSSLLLGASALVALGGGAAWADIVIATAGPMTGQYAAFGEQMKRGAEMAVKDINAAGGIDGEQLVLKIGDDACDPKQAVAVANSFVNEEVVFVAGHFCSSSSIPASAVYNEEGILQISPASTNPQLTEQGFENVFRTCGRDDQQGQVAGAHIAKEYRGKKVAVIGGGIGGLSAAHELTVRGFDVSIYETRGRFGGKARSIPVPDSASDGRKALPGEHGFRFFPGFYRHLFDTMKRIPYGPYQVECW